MNKTLRILIMFFTVVCLVVLVVFCVELILQNRGVERGVIQAPAEIEDDPDEQPPDYDGDEEEPLEDEIPEPLLDRFAIPMPGGEFILGMYVDMDRFGHNSGEILDWFVYMGGGATAFLEIHMVQIPEDSENYAIEFMEGRFDVQGVPDEDYTHTRISNSGLSGMYALADYEGTRFETWILAIPNTPNFGVAITISYRDYEQLLALEAILDTMELLSGRDADENDDADINDNEDVEE